MTFTKVAFSNFTVEPEKVKQTLPSYKAPFWPVDWEVAVCEGSSHGIIKWAMENASSRYDLTYSIQSSKYLVAFEDHTDAMLFKVSYDGE